MVKNKKRIVTILLAVSLCIVVAVLCSAQSPQTPSKEPISQTSNIFSTNDPNLTFAPSDSAGTQELFYKSMTGVLFVIVLGIAAVYVSKKFLPRITNLPGKKIRIIETVNFGTRKALHLVKISNKHLLIASTADNITKLADVTNAFPDPSQDNYQE